MWVRRCAAALLAMVLLIGAGGQAAQAQSSQTFTIPANGRAIITFEAYCVDFGGTFPATLQAPSSRASGEVRGGLAYIQSNGLSGTAKALQGQYGLWRITGAKGSPKGDATADAVYNARSTVPADPANATSILDAASAGRVSLDTTGWGPVGAPVNITSDSRDNFYGRGTLVVRNLSGQQLTLFMPIGAIFLPGSICSQRVAGYQVGSAQILSGTLPNTAALDLRPLAGLLALGLALPVHLWRRRREQLIGTKRAI